jgi:hypothetical protein
MKLLELAVLSTALLTVAGAIRAAPGPVQDADAAVRAATKGAMKPGKGKMNDRDCGMQVEYEAEAVDLNGDGQLEVLTKKHGVCFGMAGVEMNLYIRAQDGAWKPQFGFPGEPKLLKTKSHGFPDIEVLGPGQCFPVWRYDGNAYQVIKKCR